MSRQCTQKAKRSLAHIKPSLSIAKDLPFNCELSHAPLLRLKHRNQRPRIVLIQTALNSKKKYDSFELALFKLVDLAALVSAGLRACPCWCKTVAALRLVTTVGHFATAILCFAT